MMSKQIPKKTKKQKQAITKSPTPTSISKAEAENQRGIVFAQKDELTKAATCFERAIRFLPSYADAHNHLGIVLARQDKLDKAAEHYQRAIDIKPDYAIAYYNLGNLYQKQGKLEKAVEMYQQAIALNANYAEMHLNLGNVLKEQDELDKAIDCYQRALTLNPNYVDAHNNLGDIFREQKQLIEAGNHLQQAIALNPKFGLAYYNLGRVREEQGQTDHALACWKRALELMKPDDAKSYVKVGYMLKEQGKLTEAIAYYQEALTMEPDLSEAHAELGNTFRDKGLINEAIKHFRRLLEIKPTANVQTALLGALNYSTVHNQAAIFSEHKRFNEQYAIPLAASIKPHLNDRNPQRRLKIGYVSPDFRRHSVAKFIEPVLAHHDHEQYEIFCYYNHAKTDDVTQRLQEYADNWFNCVDMRSDEKLADKIRQDQIDILIDLAGHTQGDRLFVFAKKPAPIQVSYLGYPNTTGLTAIDYRITDAYRDPQKTSEPFSSESLVRIPGYYCYNPTENSPPVSECPCIQNGYITFTSFNNYAKMNPTVLALWAEVLNTIADSKLLIKTKTLSDEATQEALKEQFAQLGIAPERLILKAWEPLTTTHLKRYHQVDIGLDTYPYNGCTTTCEALWMGIPVVTLVGKTHASRMGLSILSTIGFTELIAYSHEEYVDICVKLANDTDYLQKLRAEIRERMQASPLMDGAGLTHQLEKEYRKMWEKWCAIETKFIN